MRTELVIWLNVFNKLQSNWWDWPPWVNCFELDKNSQQKAASTKEEVVERKN